MFSIHSEGVVLSQDLISQTAVLNSGSKIIENNAPDRKKIIQSHLYYNSGLGMFESTGKEKIDAALINISYRPKIKVIEQKREIFWLKDQKRSSQEGNIDSKEPVVYKPDELSDKDHNSRPVSVVGGQNNSLQEMVPVARSRLIVNDSVADETRLPKEGIDILKKHSPQSVLIGSEPIDYFDESGDRNESGLKSNTDSSISEEILDNRERTISEFRSSP